MFDRKKWQKAYNDKNKAKRRKYYDDNIEKWREYEKQRPKRKRIDTRKNRKRTYKRNPAKDKRDVELMKDHYIVSNLCNHGKVDRKLIKEQKELIELARTNLALKREIKKQSCK